MIPKACARSTLSGDTSLPEHIDRTPGPCDEDTSHELSRLRILRNKFIHAGSKELVPGTISVPEVSVTREDIEAALTAIGSYAELLEDGLEASYSKD